MWVMITGITEIEDALEARRLGADALGLVVGQADTFKPGFISPKVAASITEHLSLVSKSSPSFRIYAQQECQGQTSSPMDCLHSLPKSPGRVESFCESVLVTRLVDVQKIIALASIIGVTTIQLVGDTTPEDVKNIKKRLPDIKVIKSLHVLNDSCMECVKKYMHIVDAIELDTINIATDQIGGTGKTHDWNISKKIVQEYEYKVPIILAGGLHSDNIEKAIQTVKPFGVDVSSGVKDGRGVQANERVYEKLAYEKLASFISKAKLF